VRSWRGAFTTSPHGPEFAAGSGFECRSHVALCGLSPPDTAPASLLLSLLSPPLLSLPLVALLL
jgi:hypothetical protein